MLQEEHTESRDVDAVVARVEAMAASVADRKQIPALSRAERGIVRLAVDVDVHERVDDV
jgi:hypothetical protein